MDLHKTLKAFVGKTVNSIEVSCYTVYVYFNDGSTLSFRTDKPRECDLLVEGSVLTPVKGTI